MSDWNTRQTLIQRLSDKYDEKSWESFVHFYRPFIYMIIRKMELNHHDADEIVQQITLKAWKSLPEMKYQPEKGRFRSWLGRMAHNCALDYLKSRQRYSNKLENFKGTDISAITEPEMDELAKAEWETYLTSLAWKNIEKSFSENVKKTFELSLAGRSTEEVCEELGIKDQSVYVYKKRVKERLIEEIKRLKYELE